MSELRGERSIVIQRPTETVYEYVREIPRHVEWNHQPTEITKVTEGPIAVGSVFRAEEQAPGRAPWVVRNLMLPLMWKIVGLADYTEAEVTAMEPGRRLAWKAVAPLRNGGAWLKAEHQILLRPQNGATEVVQRYRYIPQHKLSENVTSDRAAKSMAEEVEANLARLKRILEAQAG